METTPTQVWAIGIAFQPDPSRLSQTIESLLPQVSHVLIVDNTPDPDADLGDYWRDCARRGVTVVQLGRNLGIAAAQNLGARHALRHGAQALLFFDHDSVFAPDYVSRVEAARAALGGVAAVFGGLAFDQRETDPTRRDVLAYRDTRWGPRRYPDAQLGLGNPASTRTALTDLDRGTEIPASRRDPHPAPAAPRTLPAAFLIASGLYVPASVWRCTGGMDARMFIDHVDLEWCIRAGRGGFPSYLVTDALIDHQLGDEVVKLPGREQVVHLHSPFRVFYLVRNTLWLIRGHGSLPLGWRCGYVLWLAKFVAFNLVFAPGRGPRWTAIRRALFEGLASGIRPRP